MRVNSINTVAYIKKDTYDDLLNGNLPDIELVSVDDIDTRIKDFHKNYLKVSLKETSNQDLTNFDHKENAKKGFVVLRRFDLEREVTLLEPLTKGDIMLLNKKNRDLNCVKIIIKPIKVKKIAVEEMKVSQALYNQENPQDIKEAAIEIKIQKEYDNREYQGL